MAFGGTVGFVGLGNAGGKLAGSLARNGVALTVLDLDEAAMRPLLEAGAARGETQPRQRERKQSHTLATL